LFIPVQEDQQQQEEVGDRDDPESPPDIKIAEVNLPAPDLFAQQQRGDQEAADDKEKMDPGPAFQVQVPGHQVMIEPGVREDHHQDGDAPQPVKRGIAGRFQARGHRIDSGEKLLLGSLEVSGHRGGDNSALS